MIKKVSKRRTKSLKGISTKAVHKKSLKTQIRASDGMSDAMTIHNKNNLHGLIHLRSTKSDREGGFLLGGDLYA